MTNSSVFGELLHRGILAIQSHESDVNKKPRKTIKQELATAIGRKVSTIDYYLKGHSPNARHELEQLARELFIRGHLDRVWLEEFLQSGHHPNPSVLRDELLIPGTQQLDQVRSIYKRRRMHIERQLSWQNLVQARTQIELEVIAESPLQAIRHRNIADAARAPVQFHFEPGYQQGNGDMTARVMRNDSQILVWSVEFTPPLVQHQTASYAYEQITQYTESCSYERCYQEFRTGQRHGFFAYLRYTMTVPTDELYIKTQFPPGYKLALPSSGGFAVYLGFAEDIEEKTKIITNHGFAANFDAATQSWSLELLVQSARMGLTYELQWLPPRAATLFQNAG